MKTICFLIVCSALLFACKKESWKNNATIVRNCTGTYLRIENKDHYVCNYEKLSAYPEGITVSVRYKQIDQCDKNAYVCTMAYSYEGIIEVKKVK